MKLLDPTLPRIVCAALRVGERIICGPRHFDPIIRQQINASEGIEYWKCAEQGFIDAHGRFLNRKEAYDIAMRNDQRLKRCGSDDGVLFSENLY